MPPRWFSHLSEQSLTFIWKWNMPLKQLWEVDLISLTVLPSFPKTDFLEGWEWQTPHNFAMFSGWENPNLLVFSLSAGHLGTTSSSKFLISEHEFEYLKITAWGASGMIWKCRGFGVSLMMFCRFTLFQPPQTVLGEPFPIPDISFLFLKLGCAVITQL